MFPTLPLLVMSSWDSFGSPCCFLPFCFIGSLLFAFWLWMLIEVLTKEPPEGNDRLIWLLVVILTNWIGAQIYFFLRRPERIRRFGR